MQMQDYSTNRRRLAQHMAEQIARQDVQHSDYACGTFNGLELAAALQGFTSTQTNGIVLHARDWAAANCPGIALAHSRNCVGCPATCRDIPLEPRHWR